MDTSHLKNRQKVYSGCTKGVLFDKKRGNSGEKSKKEQNKKSMQIALNKGFCMLLVAIAKHWASTRSGNRTRTAISGQGILSPSCLPIPPFERPCLL